MWANPVLLDKKNLKPTLFIALSPERTITTEIVRDRTLALEFNSENRDEACF